MTNLGHQNTSVANVGDDVANVCARAVALCARIAARDVAGSPIYVVPPRQAPRLYGQACDRELAEVELLVADLQREEAALRLQMNQA